MGNIKCKLLSILTLIAFRDLLTFLSIFKFVARYSYVILVRMIVNFENTRNVNSIFINIITSTIYIIILNILVLAIRVIIRCKIIHITIFAAWILSFYCLLLQYYLDICVYVKDK